MASFVCHRAGSFSTHQQHIFNLSSFGHLDARGRVKVVQAGADFRRHGNLPPAKGNSNASKVSSRLVVVPCPRTVHPEKLFILKPALEHKMNAFEPCLRPNQN